MPAVPDERTFDRLDTARLRGERLRPDHFEEVRRLQSDADTMTWLGGVATPEQSRAYLDHNLAHWSRYGYGVWIVYEAGASEPIGRAVLRHVTVGGVDEVETGYAFYPPYRRRGYAREVTEACTALAFDRLGLASVIALTHERNLPSRALLAKCGFVLERSVLFDALPFALFRRVRR